MPGLEAALAEERRLLVARDPRDGDAAQRRDPVDLAEDPAARADPGRTSPGSGARAGARVPVPRPRGRRGGCATRSRRRSRGRARASASRGARCRRSRTRARPGRPAPAGARDVVEEPRELRPREVGVEQQARPPPEQRPEARGARAPRTRRRCAGPARRWRGGAAAPSRSQRSVVSRWFAIPTAATSPRPAPAFAEDRERDAPRRLPEVLGLVLHPARPREMLAELLLGGGDGRPAGRTGSRGRRSCPGRGRGRSGSWGRGLPSVAGRPRGRKRRGPRGIAND
jgi:hypothetical protein